MGSYIGKKRRGALLEGYIHGHGKRYFKHDQKSDHAETLHKMMIHGGGSLKMLADSVPLIVWIADKYGKPEYFNPYWFEYTGYSPSESFENDPWTNLVHPDDREHVTAEWQKSLKTGEHFEVEYRLKHKSGNYKWFLRRANAVKDEKGAVVKWIAACTDINKQKELEREMTEIRGKLEQIVDSRTKELQKSNEDLEKFAFIASHDLKEPLRMISNYSDLFLSKSNPDDNKLQEFGGFVKDGVRQMTSLVNDLLEYARIGNGGGHLMTVDFNKEAEYEINMLAGPIKESGAEIKVEPLPSLTAYQTLIKQLFQNLIENAIKFHRPGVKPIIKISANEQETHWLFAVKDNGIGIDPRFAGQVFVVFQRLETDEKTEGTGIGLSICKRVVEKHHGSIWVESKPGQGSTFYFTISKNLH